MPVEHDPSRVEETQSLILDFAPGAWTPLHSHGGLTLVRVLEGEMTRRAHGTEDLFRAGEGWVEAPGDVHAAGNAGGTPARVLVTFLLPKCAPLTIVAGTPTQEAPHALPRTGETSGFPALAVAAAAALRGAGSYLHRRTSHA